MDPSLSLRVLEDRKYLAHPGIRTPFCQVRSPVSIRLRYPNCNYQFVAQSLYDYGIPTAVTSSKPSLYTTTVSQLQLPVRFTLKKLI